MSNTSPAIEAYQAGDLQGAIEAALADVKSKPTDTDGRGFLAELFCFAGEWERADKQLDAIGHQEPQAIVGLSLLRQLIRAEVSRAECFQEGRPPEVLFPPEKATELSLEAIAALRSDDSGSAAGLLAEAETARSHPRGVCNGEAFDDFRDLDDLCAGHFEVLTSTGKYYWVPMDRVRSIEFEPAKRARDILWRQAEMDVVDGPCGEVFFPSVYPPSSTESDDRLRLARASDWVGGEGEPVRGLGQRMFLAGESAISILQIETIEFEIPPASE